MKPPLAIKDRDVTELALSLVGPYDGVRIRFGDMVVKITGVRTMRFSSIKCYRRNLVIFISIYAISSCDREISVPKGSDISGCYYSDGKSILTLRNNAVFSDGQKISRYAAGWDDSGSFVMFQPAIRLYKRDGAKVIAIAKDLDKNYVMTTVEMNEIDILMPSEPLGEGKLVRRPCLSAR